MQAVITEKLINSLKPGSNPYEVRDQSVKGFLVRIQPSGAKSYIAQYRRGKRITLGKVGILTPTQARTRAKTAIGLASDGASDMEIREAVRPTGGDTLETFISDHYEPWAVANRKTGAEIVGRIRATFFEDLGHRELKDISPWLIEKWRRQRKEEGKKTGTINRELAALKAALSLAVEWNRLEENPIAKVKLDRVDTKPKVRFLDSEEETRLRKALANRDADLKSARERANEWRTKRNYEHLPNFGSVYADHLTPMILLSLNTGMRRGELFNLRWHDVDLEMQFLTVIGETAKSGKTRHIPLNKEALRVLESWRKQTTQPKGDSYVFPGKSGERMNNVKKAWQGIMKDAKIADFRWHDMRHHFASSLVMAGVNLYTIKDLLGHASIQMTERYSHLSPDHMAEAVARLSPPNSGVIQISEDKK